MVDYCKHGYSKAQLKARLCVDCDRAKYEATLTTLRAQLAEATRRAEAAEAALRRIYELGEPMSAAIAQDVVAPVEAVLATLDPKGGK